MEIRDLINGSLRLLGVLAEGESANAAQAQDALASLNSVIDSWSTESLSVMGTTQRIVTLAVAQQVYTMGPGGDINIPRPTKIDDVSSVYPGGIGSVYLPMSEYTRDEYVAFTVIAYQSLIPLGYYINYGFPLHQLYMYPMPMAGTQLRFWTTDVLTQFTSINQAGVFAPGYEKALRYALAIELAPEYDVDPKPVVLAQAKLAKENIQRLNVEDVILGCGDFAAMGQRYGSWNRITGDYE